MQATSDEARRDWFAQQFRTVLLSLYDPHVLRASPLAALLGVDAAADAVLALQQLLLEAIESLRPAGDAPQGSRGWRIYQILRRRYIQQMPQEKVALDLSLSVRQLQREEQVARGDLAAYLWSLHRLCARAPQIEALMERPGASLQSPDAAGPSLVQELSWLQNSVAVEPCDLGATIADVLRTIQPLLDAAAAHVVYTTPVPVPVVSLQTPILRQALLHLLAISAHCAAGGEVRLALQVCPHRIEIEIYAQGGQGRPTPLGDLRAEGIQRLEQLVRFARGTLTLEPCAEAPATLRSTLTLPLIAQTNVLIVDDNADALQLFQRYLSGSRYRFIGAENGAQALALAAELPPHIIVLDVMMPAQDGWTILSRLREHPQTRPIPVIICSIVGQKDLVLALGAADFIRKPVTRAELLAALDRQSARLQPGCD